MKLKRFIAQSLLLTFGLHVVVGSEVSNFFNTVYNQGPVVQSTISANPGLKF